MRLSSYATEHLVAEVAALPLASEEALFSAVLSLAVGEDSGATALWKAGETALLRRFPGVSIDELVNVRDATWANAPSRRIIDYVPALLRQVSAAAKDEGSALCDADHTGRRHFRRWLALSLPRDLTGLSDPGGEWPGGEMVGPQLDRWLREGGFAEVHVHFGAGLQFGEFWVGVLRSVADANLKSLKSPSAPLNGGADLGPWLLRAALGRLLLGVFLARRRLGLISGAIGLREFLRGGRGVRGLWRYKPELVLAARDLLAGSLTRPEDENLRQAYRALGGAPPWRSVKHVSEIQACDPLADLGFGVLSWPNGVTPEAAFVRSGFRYLGERRSEGRRDLVFEILLLQAIRIRTLLYRYIVERPMNSGLQWFVRHYARLSSLRGWADEVLMEATLESSGLGRGLEAIELRTAPPASSVELLKGLRALKKVVTNAGRPSPAADRKNEVAPECALVLHFVKKRGGGFDEGVPPLEWRDSNADPGAEKINLQGYRYQSYFTDLKIKAVAVARVLCDEPSTLHVLRGVDVCTDELGVPTWVIVPAFEIAREAARSALRDLKERGDRHAHPLRATAHCGEDFVHLLGGLRRVDEAIRYLGLGEGDRLGHAMALGIDPEDWARRTSCVWLPKEERLFDLVWEWSAYAEDAALCTSVGRLVYIEEQIRRLSGEIFGKKHDPSRVNAFVSDLHSPERLSAAGFPNEASRAAWLDSDLLGLFLRSPSRFRRGRKLERIATEAEAEPLHALQCWLRKKVGRLGLTVEVNPSSNLLIGDLSDLRRHPIWRLNPVRPVDSIPPVSVAIGSDDPITFATSLREEYQLLLDCLVRAGESEESAMRWLDNVREAGLRSRFTLPTEAVKAAHLEYPFPGRPLPLPGQAL